MVMQYGTINTVADNSDNIIKVIYEVLVNIAFAYNDKILISDHWDKEHDLYIRWVMEHHWRAGQ